MPEQLDRERVSRAMGMTYIDVDELTVLIAEACLSRKRPPNKTAAEVLKSLRKIDREVAEGFARAAFAAANYIAECCNAVNPGSVEVKQVTVNSGGLQ